MTADDYPGRLAEVERELVRLRVKVDQFEQFFRKLAPGSNIDDVQVVRVTIDGQELTVSVRAGEPVDLDALVASLRQVGRPPPGPPPAGGYTGLRSVSSPD